MSDPLSEPEEQASPPADVPQPVSEPPAVVEDSQTPEPVATVAEPKRRGRPQGSRDNTKRTRKSTVKLRIEPLVQEAPTQQVQTLPKAEPKTKAVAPDPPPVLEEPKSPRTLHRMYAESVLRERQQRKQELAEMYTRNWVQWPL